MMDKIYNEITDYLNTLLNEGWKNTVDKGVCKGNYILDDGDGTYEFRVPGATRGGFKVNKDGVITSFYVNYDRIINGDLGCYIVGSKELEKLLTDRFVGKNIHHMNEVK